MHTKDKGKVYVPGYPKSLGASTGNKISGKRV